jgi:hypothetical protein
MSEETVEPLRDAGELADQLRKLRTQFDELRGRL